MANYWIEDVEYYKPVYRCPFCHFTGKEEYPYCPMCGEKLYKMEHRPVYIIKSSMGYYQKGDSSVSLDLRDARHYKYKREAEYAVENCNYPDVFGSAFRGCGEWRVVEVDLIEKEKNI